MSNDFRSAEPRSCGGCRRVQEEKAAVEETSSWVAAHADIQASASYIRR